MACFSILGVLDLIIGNKFGIGKQFERGIMLLGTMTISMVGMIVIAPLISKLLFPPLESLSNIIPFDPSTIVGSLLANDMGGATLAIEFSKSSQVGYFNGLVVGSMMGATISFTIPLAMGTVPQEKHDLLMLGLMSGVITIPLGCIVSGIIIGLTFVEFMITLIPLILSTTLLIIGLIKIPKICIKIFKGFGLCIKVIILIGLAAGIFEFLTEIEIIPYTAPIQEGVDIVFNAAAVMTGAFPLVYILSKILDKPMQKIGGLLGINASSAIGFISTLATNVTTFGNMKDMDDKGIVLNSAFAVSASFVFAGHLAFTLSFNSEYIISVIVGKLVAGVMSIFIGALMYKRMYEKKYTENIKLNNRKIVK